MTSLVDDLKYNLKKVSERDTTGKCTIKLSESEAIAMFFLLQNLPVHPADQFTLLVVTNIITDLHQEFIKPTTGPKAVPHFLTIENYHS
jgi:hypothetical protein